MATFISGLALVVSIISAVYSFRLQRFDSLRSTRDQLHETINDLIKLNAENQALWSVPEERRDPSFYFRSGSIMQTAVAISRQAVYLVEQQPELVTDIEYYTIAQALVLAADYEQAEEYWRRAIDASPNDYYKVINIRAYADFLFNHGDPDGGRELYRQALRLLDSKRDIYKYSNGITEQNWMVSESNHGFWQEAENHYESAKDWFNSITNRNSREGGLAGLEQAFSYYRTWRFTGNKPNGNVAPESFGAPGSGRSQSPTGRTGTVPGT